MKKRIKINKKEILLSLLFIPFIYPKGFAEYNLVYKNFFTMWLYVSVISGIFLYLLYLIKNNCRISPIVIVTVLYFTFIVVETLLVSNHINEGLQKLFATPVLCMLCIACISYFNDIFIDALADCLILIMFLNCTVFCPPIFHYVVNSSLELIQFIGHVQVAVQIGSLGVLIGMILYYSGKKQKGIILVFLSVITMLIAKTDAGIGCFLVFILALLFRKELKKIVNKISNRMLFSIMIIVNLCTIIIVMINKINFGARFFVWLPLLSDMKGHFIFGYGVYGHLIKTFWADWVSNGIGFNYAHNEILQHLMDGGIVLVILYLL